MLIQAAQQRGIQFIYAIAPGLDITFSSEKEVEILKRKLSQVCPEDFRSLSFWFITCSLSLPLFTSLSVNLSVNLSVFPLVI